MTRWLDRLAEEVASRQRRVFDRPFIIALAGGVASGKSTLAGRLAIRLESEDHAVEVVSTDGFLLPNAELEARGLMGRKGFPDSYDWDGLGAFLDSVVTGSSPLTAPVYSQEAYDVTGEMTFARPDILILEGIIALQPPVSPVDLALYVEAAEADLITWYIHRFMALSRWAAPRLTERLAANAGDPEALALDIWNQTNGPNLRDHIAPTRARADLILAKSRDHSIRLAEPDPQSARASAERQSGPAISSPRASN